MSSSLPLSTLACFAGLLVAGTAHAQCSCAAPSCAVPSCAAPGGCGNACRASNHDCCKKCSRNIDRSRTIIKRSIFGGMMPEAPPTGVVVSSAAIVTANYPAVAVSFNGANNNIDAAAAAIARALDDRRAAPAAAAAQSCQDPCGDILQLRRDVNQLIDITNKLTLAIDKLANE